jgi:hypothetical protein
MLNSTRGLRESGLIQEQNERGYTIDAGECLESLPERGHVPRTERFAREIGTDGYAPEATSVVARMQSLL